MNLPKQSLVLPIGISGSGKSTWINSLPKNEFKIVSPDLIRKELTGDISNQESNSKVFSIAFEKAAEYIKNGETVIFDATNLDTFYRNALIDKIKNLSGINFKTYYKLFPADVELSKKRIKKDLESGKDRSNVPENVIDRQFKAYKKTIGNLENMMDLDSLNEKKNFLSESYKLRIKELAGILSEAVLSIDDIYNNYYKSVKKDEFNKIVSADPTSILDNGIPKKMGNYSKWLLNLYMRKNLKLEDLYKATEYLEIFSKNKNTLSKENKITDINKIKSLPDLFQIVGKFRTSPKPDVESVENEEDLLKNNYFVDRGEAIKKDLGNWVVVIPKTLNASKFYGCTSEWCTLFPDRFEYYSKYGDLNIFINKSKINTDDSERRVQIHVESGQFMDINDSSIDKKDFFEENPEIFDYLYNKYKDKYSGPSDIKREGDKIYIVTDGWGDYAENFNTGRDISEDFIKDVLGGDFFEYFNYSFSDFDSDYFSDEINEENLNKIKEKIKKIDSSVEIDEYDTNDLISFMKNNDSYEEIIDAILSTGVSAKESADSDEAYKKLTKAITNHYGFTEIKWIGEKLYCEISEGDYKSIFFSDYSSAKDALSNSDDNTLIDYRPPYYGYDGNIDKNYFNEELSNKLEEI
jgi:predicted kinase